MTYTIQELYDLQKKIDSRHGVGRERIVMFCAHKKGGTAKFVCNNGHTWFEYPETVIKGASCHYCGKSLPSICRNRKQGEKSIYSMNKELNDNNVPARVVCNTTHNSLMFQCYKCRKNFISKFEDVFVKIDKCENHKKVS